ncbi:hypothetical protein LCGC14_0437180 [marine sediment metagenome]|uniref:Uncharacterized protein n=1 Tax=marine sediment metagenome TaxID=412755 RepID=A0A0F9T4M4_9ZZZZ
MNIVKLLWERVDVLEQLLVCYRITKRPTEKLCTRLEKTKKDIENNTLEINNLMKG